MNRQILITASVFGALAVILGAFGAHALKERLAPADLDNWKTAVSYQFYHVVVLLFLSLLPPGARQYQQLSYFFFVVGILLFSGSIYLLSTRSLTGVGMTAFLGPMTPLGGLSLIAGWIMLLLSSIRSK